jgi:hypothetical protein
LIDEAFSVFATEDKPPFANARKHCEPSRIVEKSG